MKVWEYKIINVRSENYRLDPNAAKDLNALGADGQPAPERPPEQFRVWPVAKCVDCIVDVIVKRKREALLPWFVTPFLIVDQLLDRRLGDRLLARRFGM